MQDEYIGKSDNEPRQTSLANNESKKRREWICTVPTSNNVATKFEYVTDTVVMSKMQHRYVTTLEHTYNRDGSSSFFRSVHCHFKRVYHCLFCCL